MSFSLDRKFLAAIALSVLLFVTFSLLGARVISRLRDGIDLVDHTRAVQLQIKDVLASLVDMETSQRGYLLTHERPYLEPYRTASARLDAQMRRLAELVAQHPEQHPDFAALKERVAGKRTELARTIEMADAGRSGEALASVRAADGKVLMDDIRAILSRMGQEELRKLVAGQSTAAAAVDRSVQLGASLALLTAVLLGVIYLLMRRELEARRSAQKADAATRGALQRQVEQRTQDLGAAVDALNVSEARLRGIFESATDAIIIADENQTIVMANPAAAAMFRCTMDELIGAPVQDLIPHRFRERHRDDMRTFGASGSGARSMGRRSDVTGLRTNGEEFALEAAISQLHVDGQQLFTVILRDITERRQAERALRDSEEHLRTVLTDLPEAVIVHASNRISFANTAAQQLLGRDEAALLGLSPAQLVHPQARDALNSRIVALKSGVTQQSAAVTPVLRPDGSERLVESSARKIHRHGELSIIVFMRDVTELKRAQADVAQSRDELRRLVAAQEEVRENERKRIARELHDDLQQTLAAIKMDLATVAERVQRDDPRGAVSVLAGLDELASAAVASTRRIVNDLRPKLLDDLGLVPALQALLQQFGQRTGIECILERKTLIGDDAVPPSAASTCLYRLTQEALNNVAKHAQARKVVVQLAAGAQGWMLLRISDDGRGMGPDDRRKPQSFGLAGMEERVRTLGGTLLIRSVLDKGTTIEAAVPVSALVPDA